MVAIDEKYIPRKAGNSGPQNPTVAWREEFQAGGTRRRYYTFFAAMVLDHPWRHRAAV